MPSPAEIINSLNSHLSESPSPSQLIAEVLGAYLMRAVSAGSEILRRLQGKLLLRLTLIFWYEVSCAINTRRRTLVDHETTLSTLLHILELGKRIEDPGALCRDDHDLLPRLVLSAFLPAFRLLCLHANSGSGLDLGDRNVLRHRTTELCHAWDAHAGGMGKMEKLVFAKVVPGTLNLPAQDVRTDDESVAFWVLFDEFGAMNGAAINDISPAEANSTAALMQMYFAENADFPNHLTKCARLREQLHQDLVEFEKMLAVRNGRVPGYDTVAASATREDRSRANHASFMSGANGSQASSVTSPFESGVVSPLTDWTTPITPLSPTFSKTVAAVPPKHAMPVPSIRVPLPRTASLEVPSRSCLRTASPPTTEHRHSTPDVPRVWEGPDDLEELSNHSSCTSHAETRHASPAPSESEGDIPAQVETRHLSLAVPSGRRVRPISTPSQGHVYFSPNDAHGALEPGTNTPQGASGIGGRRASSASSACLQPNVLAVRGRSKSTSVDLIRRSSATSANLNGIPMLSTLSSTSSPPPHEHALPRPGEPLGYSDLCVVEGWPDPDLSLPEALPNQTQKHIKPDPHTRPHLFHNFQSLNPSLASLSLVSTRDSDYRRDSDFPDTISIRSSESIISTTSSLATTGKKSRLRGLFSKGAKSSSVSLHSVHSSSGKPRPVREDLDFCFSASGTSLLLWTLRNPSHMVHVAYPFRSGQLLPLRGAQDFGPISLRFVASGTNAVATILFETGAKVAKLVVFLLCPGHDESDLTGPYHRCEIALDYLGSSPTCLAVSRDDSLVAVGCGAKVPLYSLDHHFVNPTVATDNDHVQRYLALRLLSTIPAHAGCKNFHADGRRTQRVNFSVESDMLVIATQECGDAHRFPVFVSLWSCGMGRSVRWEVDLEPVVLSLGYGDDCGLSGIFLHLEPLHPSSSPVFLTARATKSYPAILPLVSSASARKRHLTDLPDMQIDSAAQCASSSGQFVAFRNGRHRVCRVDVRSGHVVQMGSFEKERSGLKVQQEGMALGVPSGGSLVYAFWKSSGGDLVLKELESRNGEGNVYEVRLNEVYWSAMQGV